MGIKRIGFLLLGGPSETRDTVEESLEFAESLRLDSLKITVGIRIYPHTPLAALPARSPGTKTMTLPKKRSPMMNVNTAVSLATRDSSTCPPVPNVFMRLCPCLSARPRDEGISLPGC